MNEKELKQLLKLIPDDAMPTGHAERFQSRLLSALPLQHKLWTLQKYLIAASVVILLAGSLYILINRNGLFFQNRLATNISPEFLETENYLQNEIQNKMKILSDIDKIDPGVLNDLNQDDESFKIMRRDLRKNPGDIRLTCAVIETYQKKIDVLDEMIVKNR
jgi:hypothetical protein